MIVQKFTEPRSVSSGCKIILTSNIYCNTVSIANQVLRLHERMGHPSSEAMCTAINFGAWKNVKVTSEQVRRVMKQNPCNLINYLLINE